nr:hypothetical protein [Tanacetum cinerariifolium]
MARLQFCDYHNMVAILEKSEHNGEGSGTPTEPHHTPSLEAQQPSPTTHSSPIFPLLPHLIHPLRQYTRRARIAQSPALPPVADEHASPLRDEFTDLCTSLQRQQSNLMSKFEAQEVEITMLKARVKLLEDREGGGVERSRNDAPIKGRSLDEGEEVAEKGSNDTEEMINVLTSMDASTVLSSEVAEVPTSSGSILTASPPAAEVPIGSDVVPTAEIARIHAEEELQIMIDGLDRSNETVAKYLQEYHHFATELPFERRIELISDLVRGKRFKRKGIRFEQESVKNLKTSEEVKASEEVPEEKVKEMMQLVPTEEVYVEVVQVKHPIIDWKGGFKPVTGLSKESLNIRPTSSDKEMELWVELKRL